MAFLDSLNLVARAAFIALSGLLFWSFVRTRDGTAKRRLQELFLAFSVIVGWFTLAWLDAMADIVPRIDLRRLSVDWVWIPYGLLDVALIRFWVVLFSHQPIVRVELVGIPAHEFLDLLQRGACPGCGVTRGLINLRGTWICPACLDILMVQERI